jgi:hypothetical protein
MSEMQTLLHVRMEGVNLNRILTISLNERELSDSYNVYLVFIVGF